LLVFLKGGIFLIRKMEENRKMPTWREMIDQLEKDKVLFPPLTLRFLKLEPEISGGRSLDALVEISWRKSRARFAVECKALSTPKAFQSGLNNLKASPLPKGYAPLLFVPFLGKQQLLELESEGISGIDLCGNGVVILPDKFFIFRGGERNRFSSSAPIKNIYRKNSSMAARVFLIRSQYKTVQQIYEEINRNNLLVISGRKKQMSLSTVSKALKTLEEDLIVERNESIHLLQPDTLLEKLSENYVPPRIKEQVRLKVPEEGGRLRELLVLQSQASGLPFVATGMSSVQQYTVMQRTEVLSVYCPDIDALLERLAVDTRSRFPNLELIETEDETVFFDVRQEENFNWASPIQVYLELMAGDKRDKETAEAVMSYIIENIRGAV
jgi:hypothetical protein